MSGNPRAPQTHEIWDEQSLKAPHAQRDKAARVQAMFDAIAPTYERVNTVATFGRDAAWRRRAIASLGLCGEEIALDICCGTGDVVRQLAGSRPRPRLIIGLDFAGQMLARGRYPGVEPGLVQLCRGDGLRLPVANESVDVITCAFGVRNFQDLQAGLNEMRRVLRVGGRVAILEFGLPENALLRWGYRLYCERVLPRLGTLISRDRSGAYRYLPKSIGTFESSAMMVRRLESAGFADVAAESMNFGGVLLYRGRRGSGR